MCIRDRQYKRLWTVEHWFRSCKSLLQTRPIDHKCDETIRGHVFCSFLALVLRQELQARLEERGHKFEWADVIQDLDRLQSVTVEQDGKQFLLRSEAQGTVVPCASLRNRNCFPSCSTVTDCNRSKSWITSAHSNLCPRSSRRACNS